MKLILHAPTPAALERARNNAMNFRREAPEAEVRIIANAAAVGAALDGPHPEADGLTWVCPNTLARTGRELGAPLRRLDGAAVVEIARLQHEGWAYMRA